MNFLLILIALSTPFWGNAARMIQQQTWLNLLFSKIVDSLASLGLKKAETLLAVALLIVFALTQFIHALLASMSHEILGYLFSLFILIYAIGDFAFLTSPIAEEMLREFIDDLFSVIFWFLLLGPAGALLYRLVSYLSKADAQDAMGWRAEILLEWLDWIPSRMIALGFAFFGHFSAGIKMMTLNIMMPSRDNIRYLARCFQAVLMQEEVSENKVLIATEYLRKLLLRTSAMWLVIVFLISLM